MNDASISKTATSLVVGDETAGELMTLNPISVSDAATLHEAAVLLTKRGFSAAPVVDAAGRAVGVLSRTDIVGHDPKATKRLPSTVDYYQAADPFTTAHDSLFEELEIALADPILVRDIMTPRVLSVRTTDSMLTVISKLVACKVHRVFVIDGQGMLVGVISAYDVLRKICADNPSAATSCDNG